LIAANIADFNTGEGIYIAGEAEVGGSNTIERNQTNGNLGNGIVVSSSGHVIQLNEARNNDGWGIYAVLSNNDGGGNRASGNAEAAQCFGVICTP
jgi:hypothetical protein